MRVPLLALLSFALGTLASLVNAHFTDDIDERQIHDDALTFNARRSFHDNSALERRDIIASLSTRDMIDGLNRRTSWYCGACTKFLYNDADEEARPEEGEGVKIVVSLHWCQPYSTSTGYRNGTPTLSASPDS
ncbi:hypothetical protein DFP72DRAFT_856807 [Ephemerocybe angulata]|uniref:Uncharacterized protein n=1 Tax=Ephemerocybe angulata TaxID=980116 RepID=A0A8H6LWW4_9AGAR|nr:hypothetical protein DFP72DRAFT_856807 [Tulosesus angulatus]